MEQDVYSTERSEALAYQKITGKTKYFYDTDGDEYWYVDYDENRHYTKIEG